MNKFETDWHDLRARTEKVLHSILPGADAPPARLHEAMRYATLNGGKRIRAVLVYTTGRIFGTELDHLDSAAAAIELIHAYSLVHDDLPAMDDDDMRRGKPSCHKAYGEATATLTGDALQTLAFQALSEDASGLSAERRTRMIAALAVAAGSSGMAGGQEMDIAMTDGNAPGYDFDTMHLLKTAALINASVQLGAIASGKAGDESLEPLGRYGRNIGLAFQCVDDALDGENSDISSKHKALHLRDLALDALDELNTDAAGLRRIAEFVVNRTH